MSSTALGSGDIVAERYRIDGLLGQGGMGSVYRAVQLSMGRAVALKLLATEQPATREQVERFEREAQALARLQHPSTVRLFDFGSVEPGCPFIVMELLGGADLEQDLAHNGPMRWDQALRVCRQVLGSLGEAHALGIIHRDVKPANVYLCAGAAWPAVKLLDFGIAGCVELSSTRKLTATGTVLGSAPYMSPEQAQGQPVGPAADLYALGVVLFEMLTGRTPFAGRGFTAQLVAKVLEPAPRLLDVSPALALPAELCELVGQLLERDADRRPASALALSERFAALLESHGAPMGELPELARPLPSREPRALPARTEPMLVPRTIADGWVPPSVPPTVPRRRRSGRAALLALSLATPALGLAWWAREPKAPSAVAGDGPAALLSATAPSGDAELARPGPAGSFPVQVASATAPNALDEELGGAIAEPPDAGGADAGGAAPPEPAVALEQPHVRGASRHAKKPAEALVAPRQAPKGVGSPAKTSSGPRRAAPARTNPAQPEASAGAGRAVPGGVLSRKPEAPVEPGLPEPPALNGATASSAPASSAPASSAPASSAPASSAPAANGGLPGSLPEVAPPGAVVPEGAARSAGLPSRAEASASSALPPEALPVPARPGPSPWVEAQPGYTPAPIYTPAPSLAPDPRASREPIPERSARWLLRRYPTVARASEAARAGEITPNERNLIVAELRRARLQERGRAIRQYRAGYLGRDDLRDRLREIDRRYDGAFEQYPRAGIHIWP